MADFLSSTDKQTLGAFWRAMLVHRKDLYLALFIPLSTIAINTVAPYATSNVLAGLVSSSRDLDGFILLLLVASVLGVFANRIGFIAYMKLVAKTSRDLEGKALEMLLQRGVSFHANNVGGKLVSDAIDYARSYQQVQNALFIDLLPFFLTVLIGVAIIMVQSFALGLIMFVMSLMIIAWAWQQSLKRGPARTRRKEAQRNMTAHIGDSITNVMAVKSFASEAAEMKRHRSFSQRLFMIRMKDWVEVAVDGTNRHAALLSLQFLFVLYLVQAAHHNPHLLGVSIFAFSYSVTMTNRLFQINQIIRTLEDGLVEAAPITDYLAQAIEITDRPNAQPLHVSKGAIVFNQLTFKYQDNENTTEIFRNFDLEIKPGERIGLVGPSGGGKSTLMKLLLRFEDPTDGSITIDGQNISLVTQASLRRAISYVPQEPLLFHRTIAENIAYGSQETPSPADIEAAAQKAQAYDFIQTLNKGFDTVVGERGVKLSGGQRQRIAIARAILKNAPILLLDEATSALDSESEKYIQEALHELMKQKTVIVIAHRLSTINELDRIVVVDDGTIIEEGTHKQLLQNKKLYAKLWNRQSGGFIED